MFQSNTWSRVPKLRKNMILLFNSQCIHFCNYIFLNPVGTMKICSFVCKTVGGQGSYAIRENMQLKSMQLGSIDCTMQHTMPPPSQTPCCLQEPRLPEVVIQLTVNYCYILISNKPSSITTVKVTKAIAWVALIYLLVRLLCQGGGNFGQPTVAHAVTETHRRLRTTYCRYRRWCTKYPYSSE